MVDLHDELDAWLPKFGQKWAFDKQKGFDIARGELLAPS